MKFRKKPVVIEAIRFTGDNSSTIAEFCMVNGKPFFEQGEIYNTKEYQWVHCPEGHWVIKGVAGEFYPCDPEVFELTYEKVDE